MKPRLLVVDDHPVVAHGVTSLLAPLFPTESGFANSGSEALELVTSALNSQPYTLAIVDFELPSESGVSVVRRLRSLDPRLRFVIYTMHEEVWVVKELEEASVEGIIFKSEASTSLKLAAEAVLNGMTYRSPRFQALQTEAPRSLLSERELGILQMMSRGLTSRAIAEELCLSENTIEYHRKRMMRKLAADNVVELILRAQRQGILKPDFNR
ncbi:MAG: LuxR C-terminal-related transcriptional regulator [Alloprevotella sp.]